MRLADDQLPVLARLIAEQLRGDGAGARVLVDAEELARRLGMSRRFVYEHADELGAIRLGDGPKARMRFDVERAEAAMRRYGSRESQAENRQQQAERAPRRRRQPPRLPNGLPKPGSVLAVRGPETGSRR